MLQARIFFLITFIQNIGSVLLRIGQKVLVPFVLFLFVLFSYYYVNGIFTTHNNSSQYHIQSSNMKMQQNKLNTVNMTTKIVYLSTGAILLYNLVYNYIMAYRIGPGSPCNIQDHILDEYQVYKKCKKCSARKPIRSHHCSICNKCVLQMDHHCPWLGTCIGHYNRRFFLKFLTYLTFVSLLVVLMIINLELPRDDMYIFMLMICIILGLFCAFHWFIALILGRTTLQLCQISDGYKPIKSICTNFEIIFGTRNIILAFLPYYIPLNHHGCEWNKDSYRKISPSEVEQSSIIDTL